MKLGYRFILSAPLLFISCSPYQVKHISAPTNLIPNQLEQPDSAKNKKHNNLWWYEFKDPDLVTLIDILLDQNFDLKEAYQRLKQAEAQRTIAVSQQYPQVSLGTGLSRNHSERPGEQITGNPQAPDFRRSVTTLEAGATLQYEIDLWKRLDSLAESAKLQQQASKADLEGVLNTILGQVTNLWFNLKSQSALERLLSQQINTSQHYLDLINLRFQAGISPGLEVLQQKQQLASLLTQLPEIQQNLDLTHSRLATLLGLNKQELVIFPISSHLPVLPSFPDKIKPIDLFASRPDLRRAQLRAQAAEYDLAAVFADRFPKLEINLSYNFSTEDFSKLFEAQAGKAGIAANLPIIDGGKRRANFKFFESKSNELFLDLSKQTLQAFNEISQIIAYESEQLKKLDLLSQQTKLASSTVDYARERYKNGALSYLEVLINLRAAQKLDQSLLAEQADILKNRVLLYQSLGTPWKINIDKKTTFITIATNPEIINE